MSRREALGRLLAAPRDHVDQSRIGRKVIYATSDGREKVSFTVRVLRSVLRRAS